MVYSVSLYVGVSHPSGDIVLPDFFTGLSIEG